MRSIHRTCGILPALALTVLLAACGGGHGPAPASDDRFDMQTAESSEPPGAYCANGGIKVEEGFDIDGSGTLGLGEVVSTTYRCNGVGSTGPQEWVEVKDPVQAQPDSGYVAGDEHEPVIVTLPTDLAEGATVRVKGAGAGGWKIVQNDGQRVSGLRAPGAAWSPAPEVARNWVSSSFTAHGRELLAAEAGGQIYKSTDYGATWAPTGSGTGNRVSVTSSASGDLLAAAVPAYGILGSTDGGGAWAPTPGPYGLIWTSVTVSGDGRTLLATTAYNGIRTSFQGAWWSEPIDNIGLPGWQAAALSADGSKLVAVPLFVDGRPETGNVYTAIKVEQGWTWTEHSTGEARIWASVTLIDDQTLLAGESNGRLYLSTNGGDTWDPTGPAESRGWASLASLPDGSLVATVQAVDESGGLGPGRIHLSWTGTTPGKAGSISGGASASVELRYVGGGVFEPVTREGELTIE